jgi:hypothetical protein
MSFVRKTIDSLTGGSTAAGAATAGAQISADAANRALDYLKEEEAIPQFFRKGSLNIIGGLSGLGDMAGQDAASKIKDSEIYRQVMSSKMAGEDAILRNASVTGGLRSGNTNDALARYSGDLQQQAFFQGLNSLQGLAQLPSNANNIAAATAGVGDILGQGQVAAGQAIAAGRGALIAGVSNAFKASDARLKKKIIAQGQKNGHNWYKWDWSENAAQFGLIGRSEGVLAQEVLGKNPEAVGVKDGYLAVNYVALGLA